MITVSFHEIIFISRWTGMKAAMFSLYDVSLPFVCVCVGKDSEIDNNYLIRESEGI